MYICHITSTRLMAHNVACSNWESYSYPSQKNESYEQKRLSNSTGPGPIHTATILAQLAHTSHPHYLHSTSRRRRRRRLLAEPSASSRRRRRSPARVFSRGSLAGSSSSPTSAPDSLGVTRHQIFYCWADLSSTCNGS